MESRTHFERLIGLIGEVEIQADKYGVFKIIDAFAKSVGFMHTTIGQNVNPALQDITYPDLGVSNYPEDFQRSYILNEYLFHDPIIKHARESRHSFHWHDVKVTNYQEKKIMKECQEAGMIDGLTIPVHVPSRIPGIISFAGEAPDLKPREIKALELLCYHGYTKLLEIHMKRREKPKITPRQVDVLNHVATGKTDWEIGKILNIAEGSVKEHLSEARRKLNASNRAHCVTIAIREGLIFL